MFINTLANQSLNLFVMIYIFYTNYIVYSVNKIYFYLFSNNFRITLIKKIDYNFDKSRLSIYNMSFNEIKEEEFILIENDEFKEGRLLNKKIIINNMNKYLKNNIYDLFSELRQVKIKNPWFSLSIGNCIDEDFITVDFKPYMFVENIILFPLHREYIWNNICKKPFVNGTKLFCRFIDSNCNINLITGENYVKILKYGEIKII